MAECNEGEGLSRLLDLFPDIDPHFLYNKAMELGGNLDEINYWIQEVMDKDMAWDFPKTSNREEEAVGNQGTTASKNRKFEETSSKYVLNLLS